MKNRKFQSLIVSAKHRLSEQSGNRPLVEGVHIPHLYDGSRTLTYWDDFSFRLGSQWFAVWMVHPRYKLTNIISDMAYKAIPVDHDDGFNIRDTFEPISEPVGKSRKKVKMYQMKPTSDSWKDLYSKRKQFQIDTIAADDVSVGLSTPVINQYRWGRGMELEYPVELLSDCDIVNFAHRVKSHLKGEIDLFSGLEGYRYTTSDYRNEHPDWETNQ